MGAATLFPRVTLLLDTFAFTLFGRDETLVAAFWDTFFLAGFFSGFAFLAGDFFLAWGFLVFFLVAIGEVYHRNIVTAKTRCGNNRREVIGGQRGTEKHAIPAQTAAAGRTFPRRAARNARYSSIPSSVLEDSLNTRMPGRTA